MNQVDKISKEALNLLNYSKDVAANNLTSLNKEGKLSPPLNESQLQTIVSVLESSFSQGFQKGLTNFQKSIKVTLESEKTQQVKTSKK